MSTGKLGERMPLKSYFEQYQHNQDLVSIAASFLVHIFRMELQTYQVHMSTGKNKLSTHTNDIWSEASRFISKAQVSRMHWYSLLNIVPNDEYMSLQLVKLDFFILAFELLQMMAHPALAKAIILEAAATLTHSPWSPFTGVKNQQDPSIWQTSQFVEDFALPITVAAMASRSSFRRLFPNRCQPCPAWPYSAPCDLHSILLLPALFLDETFKLKVLRLSTMILMQFRWPTVDTERLLAQLGIEGPESRSSDNLNWRMSLALCARARGMYIALGQLSTGVWLPKPSTKDNDNSAICQLWMYPDGVLDITIAKTTEVPYLVIVEIPSRGAHTRKEKETPLGTRGRLPVFQRIATS